MGNIYFIDINRDIFDEMYFKEFVWDKILDFF